MSGQEDHIQISSKVVEEAAAWHVRLHSDDASEADFLAFEAWVVKPEHRAAYDHIDIVSVELDVNAVELLQKVDAREATVVSFPSKQERDSGVGRTVTRRMWVGGALAAGLTILVAGPLLRQPRLNWTSYETASGETRNIKLEDGSVVTLNGASRIKVAFTPKERRVEMAEAEATFDVAKNPERPFLISARDHEIRVVGTEFNVFNFEDATRVTVRRGIVQVRRNNTKEVVRLPAGQEFAQKGKAAPIVRSVDPETAFSWRSGNLVYEDAQLTEVVSALNRRFKAPMRLVDPSAEALRFSGVLSLDSEEAVVRRLEAFLPISAEYSDGQYLLRRRAD